MKGRKPLNGQEIDATLASINGVFALRDKALFVMGLNTGLRVSELLSLRVRDVLQYGRISDVVQVQRRNKKGGFEGQNVYVNEAVVEALQAWLASLGDVPGDTYLFCSRKGGNAPIGRKSAYDILKKAFGVAEVTGPTGTHSMRKTFAQLVYEGTEHDLVATQAALGHRNFDSTVKYLGFNKEKVSSVVKSLNVGKLKESA